MSSDRPRGRRGAHSSSEKSRAAKSTRVAVPPPPPIAPEVGARAALTLGVGVALLLALRTAAAFESGTLGWGFHALRFVSPWLGWLPWVLLELAFVPPIARRALRGLETWGDAIGRNAFAPQLAAAASVAALVLALPDRLWFVGDFLLRLGCTRGQVPVTIVFPQALPLDLWLHHHLPIALYDRFRLDPNGWERLLGALEAGTLAWFAMALARVLGLRGAAAAACAGAAILGGFLGMFTGYGKGLVELTLGTVAAAVFALDVARRGRGAWPLALVVIATLTLHRSGLALLVPLAAAAVVWRREHAAKAGGSGPTTIAAFLAPLVAVLALLPILIESMKVTDRRHLAPTGASPGAILGAAFGAGHLLDVANLVGLAATLAFLIVPLALALRPSLAARSREALVLAGFALPALTILLLIHPRQGLFRDADVFMPSLAALAVIAAALVGEAVRGAGSRGWLAVPVLLFMLLVTTQTLLLTSDVSRGLARVEAYLEGRPRRPDEERALLWTYLAERTLALRRLDQAVHAYERAAELAPSPRILVEWALAERDRGNFGAAVQVFRRVVGRAPTFTEGWIGLAEAAMQAGDWAEARRAVRTALALEPEHSGARALALTIMRNTPRDSAATPDAP